MITRSFGKELFIHNNYYAQPSIYIIVEILMFISDYYFLLC